MTTTERARAVRRRKQAERWIALVEKLRRVRKWVREPIPEGTPKHERDWWEASRTLRFMLYVGRSNISEDGRGNQIYQISKHHCCMGVGVWIAMHGVYFSWAGAQKGAYWGSRGANPRFNGCIIACPPGHGKSEFATHETAMWLIDNVYEQILVGHAKENMASIQLKYTSALFDTKEPVGRRCHALFPDVRLATDKKKRTTATTMYLETDQTLKAASMRSHGINEAISGSNATKMLLDDPVDEKEADEATTRERKFNRINNTWLTRLRGAEETFLLVTTTIWHEDDSASRLIALARNGKARYVVVQMPAGGPENNFKPVWSEMYGRAYLRAKYHANPTGYRTVYMMQPASKSGRIVNSVRYFDPDSEEHRSFMETAVIHVSLDPSATNRKKSDKHGVVSIAVGEIVQEVKTETGKNISTRRVARVYAAETMQASPTDVLGSIAARAAVQRVDWFHMETVAGFGSLAEVAENLYEIPVVRHQPSGAGSKEQRLRAVAPMMDASLPGMIPCVEFPHHPGDPSRAHEDIRWLIDQILRFGSTKADDGVDALTQLLRYLMGELSPGVGAVTKSVQEALQRGNPALRAMYDALRKQREAGASYNEADDYLVLER